MIFFKKRENENTDDLLGFRILFDTHKEKIYKIAYCIVQNEQDAKDIVQDTFITAFQKINQLKEREKFSSWVSTIACNLAKTKYNKRKREILINDDDKIMSLIRHIDSSDIPCEIIALKESKEELKMHIDSLKTQYREVIVLYYYAELSYEEISQITGENIGTVKSRLFRAKQILKKTITNNSKYYYENGGL